MSYAGHASHFASELFDSLTEEDIDLLREDLNSLGVEGWLEWHDQNEKEINAYLRATPAQRAKKRKWAEDVLRRRLIFGGYRQARLAADYLDAMPYFAAGGGYREVCASAAHQCLKIIEEGAWRWPFGGELPKGWPGPKREYYQTISYVAGGERTVREGFTLH